MNQLKRVSRAGQRLYQYADEPVLYPSVTSGAGIVRRSAPQRSTICSTEHHRQAILEDMGLEHEYAIHAIKS